MINRVMGATWRSPKDRKVLSKAHFDQPASTVGKKGEHTAMQSVHRPSLEGHWRNSDDQKKAILTTRKNPFPERDFCGECCRKSRQKLVLFLGLSQWGACTGDGNHFYLPGSWPLEKRRGSKHFATFELKHWGLDRSPEMVYGRYSPRPPNKNDQHGRG
jgi:hypothetical protein